MSENGGCGGASPLWLLDLAKGVSTQIRDQAGAIVTTSSGAFAVVGGTNSLEIAYRTSEGAIPGIYPVQVANVQSDGSTEPTASSEASNVQWWCRQSPDSLLEGSISLKDGRPQGFAVRQHVADKILDYGPGVGIAGTTTTGRLVCNGGSAIAVVTAGSTAHIHTLEASSMQWDAVNVPQIESPQIDSIQVTRAGTIVTTLRSGDYTHAVIEQVDAGGTSSTLVDSKLSKPSPGLVVMVDAVGHPIDVSDILTGGPDAKSFKPSTF